MKTRFLETNWRPWVESLIAQENIPNLALQNMLYQVCVTLMSTSRLVSFAREAILLWPRCTPDDNLDSLPTDEKDFATEAIGAAGLNDYQKKLLLKELARRGLNSLERYPNHPEFFAFQFARGQFYRGDDGVWNFHHLYTGQHPFPGRKRTLNAHQHGQHFTQTAGMTCVHPIVEELLSQFRCIVYVLRARSFLLFRYDPDHYFSRVGHDSLGFVRKPTTRARPVCLDEDDVPSEEAGPTRLGRLLRARVAAGQRPRCLDEDD